MVRAERTKEREIKKVVIYRRVSSPDQVLGYSLTAQLEDLETYCKLFNYEIVGSFCDEGVTGTSIDARDDFKKMEQSIKENQNVDAVIVWKLSRISRSMSDLVGILAFLEENNVELISIKDNLSTLNIMGKTMIYLIGVFSEMERDSMLIQMKSGMRQKALSGGYNGGTTPFGYSLKEGKLIVNEEEAKVVKEIFELYTFSDYGFFRIADYLNNKGVKRTPSINKKGEMKEKDTVWSISTVKWIIDNPIYAGKIQWGKKGKDDNDVVIVDGQHEAIIGSELWEETVNRRKTRGVAFEKTTDFNWMLTGIIKCPECGSSMRSHRSKTSSGDG